MKPAPLFALLVLLGVAPRAHAEGWNFAPGGNFQYDWYRPRADVYPYVDADDFRRARISATARYGDRWEFKAEYDLEPGQWTDLYGKYSLGGGHSLRIGQFKQPLFLEELTSDKVLTFMEQGLPGAFAVARRAGVEYAWVNPDWTLTSTAYGKNLNANGDSDTLGFAARGTWVPWRGDGAFIHLGLAATTERPDAERARFSSRPETGMRQRALVDTGLLGQSDTIARMGLEGAWVDGPWSLQGEYTRVDVSRDGTGDFAGQGWYVNASWFPTGQSRSYKGGVFDGPVFGESGRNAWELALRVSHLDLDDGDVQGGELTDWTAGVNWYASKHLRLTANYVVADSERQGIADDPRILQFRAQFTF